MDIRHILHHYLEEQVKVITDSLSVIEKRMDRAAIHDVRVAVKKIRATLELGAALSEHAAHPKKYFRPFRALQAATGTLRDLQLQITILRKYERLTGSRYPLFHLLLQNNYTLAREQLSAAVRLFRPKQPDTLPEHDISTEDIQAYFREELKSMQPLTGRAAQDAWHALRKRVKRFHFQLHLLQDHLPHGAQVKRLLSMTKRAGHLLGEWHDLQELWMFIGRCKQQAVKEGVAVPRGTEGLMKRLREDSGAYLKEAKGVLGKIVEMGI